MANALGRGCDKKLMVVEDDPDLTEIWRRLFHVSGYRKVVFCNTRQAALASLDEGFCPDLFLTDYYLPDTTGLDLIDEVKRQQPNLACILVTGIPDAHFAAQVREERGIAVLLKPMRFNDLHDILLRLGFH